MKLRAAGVDCAKGTPGRGILERVATANGKALAALQRVAAELCSGESLPERPASGETLCALGKRWTSGELARDYPDHVRRKKTFDDDVQRLETHVYPVAGHVAVADFTLDDAEAVMRRIPAERSPATRRHVAQLLHRLMGMAVFPLRLRMSNPLPKGFLPKLGASKAKAWIYPDEDRKLLASPSVPLVWRVFYGFLDREGLRSGEAASLDLGDVDLDRGAVNLDQNKTDDPRTWALSPGVVAGLRAWLALRAKLADAPLPPSAPLFVDENGARVDVEGRSMARMFRVHLRAAGVDRAELHTSTGTRQQIRLHDLRATMITTALANGRSETWVSDRTGHESGAMIQRYRRAAWTASELALGELAPLDVAIPELGSTPASEPDDGPAAKGNGKRQQERREGATGSGASPKSPIIPGGTEGGTRTHKPLRIADFESAASAIPPLRPDARGKVVHFGVDVQPQSGPGCVLLARRG